MSRGSWRVPEAQPLVEFHTELGTATFLCAYPLLLSLDGADGSQLNTLTGAFHPLPAAPSAWQRAGWEASTPMCAESQSGLRGRVWGGGRGRHLLGS